MQTIPQVEYCTVCKFILPTEHKCEPTPEEQKAMGWGEQVTIVYET